MTIEEFCEKHGACCEGFEWAISTGCKTMTQLWGRDDIKPEWRIWIATRPGVMSDKDLRLFACWCVRQVWHLLKDERSKRAVEVSEKYANGIATESELDAAWDAAADAAANAAQAAAWSAARAAARAAAWSAARAAAWDAAWAATANAAWDAAADAAWDAAWDAAADAARSEQSKQLINYDVNFGDNHVR